jgi:hypothetical protein
MREATTNVTIRDFLIFQTKLLIDGAKDVALFNLSIGAFLVDLVTGRGRKPRYFYRVLRMSERFDLWLNLHGAAEGAQDTDDGLFGASLSGSPTLLGQLEAWFRGGDAPGTPGWTPEDDEDPARAAA